MYNRYTYKQVPDFTFKKLEQLALQTYHLVMVRWRWRAHQLRAYCCNVYIFKQVFLDVILNLQNWRVWHVIFFLQLEYLTSDSMV